MKTVCESNNRRGADAMEKLSKGIVKSRYIILIVAFVLLIPAAIQYKMTRINYDVLTYLPKNIETMKGQDIMLKQYGVGSFSLYMVEGMQPKEVAELKAEIEKVPHVDSVLWYDSFMDLDIPMDMLPKDIYEAFNNNLNP
jgi:predicted RND superfamily exporter protein